MTKEQEQRLMLVAMGMALANKQARKRLDMMGTEYSSILAGLQDAPENASYQELASHANDQHALKMFMVSLGFHLTQLANPTEFPQLVIAQTNKVTLWRRASRWMREKFRMCLLPVGDLHEKIEKAKSLGYRDDSHQGATQPTPGMEGSHRAPEGQKREQVHGVPVGQSN